MGDDRCAGTRAILRSRHVIAAIVIDYVNAGGSTGLLMRCSGQFSGYTPMWLRALVASAATTGSVKLVQPRGATEWAERAVEISEEDQGALLRDGIPALNLETTASDLPAAHARYHTTRDVYANFDPASFTQIGATVERAVHALDAIPELPQGGGADFLASDDKAIPGPFMMLILSLVVLPFVVLAYLEAQAVGAGHIRSWVAPVIWASPAIAGALALRGLALANVLPRYELYPATLKDPFLYTLPLQAILPLLLVLGVGYWCAARWAASDAPTRSFGTEKSILVVWSAGLLVVAFVANPYGALLFLSPLVISAALLVAPTSASSKALNAFLVVFAAFPFALLLYLFGNELYLGWRILWYAALQAAYGTWSAFVIVAFAVALAIWLGLIRNGVSGTVTRSSPRSSR